MRRPRQPPTTTSNAATDSMRAAAYIASCGDLAAITLPDYGIGC